MNFSLGKRDAGTTPLHLLPAATLTVTLVGWFISRKQFDISQIGHDQADFKTLSGLAIVEQVFASYSIGTIFLAVTCGLIGFLTLAHILDAFSEFLFESVGQNLIFGTSLDRLRGTCQVEELLKKNVNSVGNDIENKIRKIRKAAIIFLTIIVLSIIWSAVERTAIIYQKIPIWFLDSAFFFFIYIFGLLAGCFVVNWRTRSGIHNQIESFFDLRLDFLLKIHIVGFNLFGLRRKLDNETLAKTDKVIKSKLGISLNELQSSDRYWVQLLSVVGKTPFVYALLNRIERRSVFFRSQSLAFLIAGLVLFSYFRANDIGSYYQALAKGESASTWICPFLQPENDDVHSNFTGSSDIKILRQRQDAFNRIHRANRCDIYSKNATEKLTRLVDLSLSPATVAGLAWLSFVMSLVFGIRHLHYHYLHVKLVYRASAAHVSK